MPPWSFPTQSINDQWRLIETKPDRPMAVLYWYGGMEPLSAEAVREERFGIGYWRNGRWYDNGTGHDLFERWCSPEYLPTHWRPLPPPPNLTTERRETTQVETSNTDATTKTNTSNITKCRETVAAGRHAYELLDIARLVSRGDADAAQTQARRIVAEIEREARA